jgi:hypothetical protein
MKTQLTKARKRIGKVESAYSSPHVVLGVGVSDGNILMTFGSKISHLVLDPVNARLFANSLLDKLRLIERGDAMPKGAGSFVEVEVDEVLAETEEAVFVLFDEEQIWIPKSQMEDPDVTDLIGESATLSVRERVAVEKGLV